MLTVSFLLVLAAFLITLASTRGQASLWVAVLLLALERLLVLLPLR